MVLVAALVARERGRGLVVVRGGRVGCVARGVGGCWGGGFGGCGGLFLGGVLVGGEKGGVREGGEAHSFGLCESVRRVLAGFLSSTSSFKLQVLMRIILERLKSQELQRATRKFKGREGRGHIRRQRIRVEGAVIRHLSSFKSRADLAIPTRAVVIRYRGSRLKLGDR